jgi:hypothetical protein
MKYSKADLNDLKANLAWQEITERIVKMLEQADKDIENGEPFEHGKAVGARDKLRIIAGLPAELERVIDSGGTPVTKIR